MSFDAVTWAKAQPIPLKSQGARRRAKSVLVAFAAYADAHGRGWAAVDVLVLETDMDRRTVFRGLADLQACGLMVDTGDQHVERGKCYPLFQLPLDHGPQNTRERLRQERAACASAQADEAEGGPALGVSPVSPQAGDGAICGDTGDTGRGDTGARSGVTPVTPKQELEPHLRSEGEPQPGAREAAARLKVLEGLAPAAILRFYNQPMALAAMLALLASEGAGYCDQLPEAMRRMKAHRAFRTRHSPPQLHDWIKNRAFLGWLADDEPQLPLDEPAPAEPTPADLVPSLPRDVADVVYAQGRDWAASWLARAEWREVGRLLLTATGYGRDKVRERLAAKLAAIGVRVECVKDFPAEGAG